MRKEEYLQGILGALGVGEDKGVPDPVWRHEEYLKAIYDKLKEGGGSLPPVTEADNGKVMAVIDGEWEPSLIPIDDEKIEQFVDAWLDDHPEATTTVTDGSITNAKLASSFVTPGTAAAYSSSATYAVGDYVFYGGTLYRCNTAITTAEAWTAAHWTQVNLGDDMSVAKYDINEDEPIIGVHRSQTVQSYQPLVPFNIPKNTTVKIYTIHGEPLPSNRLNIYDSEGVYIDYFTLNSSYGNSRTVLYNKKDASYIALNSGYNKGIRVVYYDEPNLAEDVGELKEVVPQNTQKITDVIRVLNDAYYNYSGWENATWSRNNSGNGYPIKTANANRASVGDLLPIRAGSKIHIEGYAGQKYAYAFWKYNASTGVYTNTYWSTSWMESSVDLDFTEDLYVSVSVANTTDTSPISISNVGVVVSIYDSYLTILEKRINDEDVIVPERFDTEMSATVASVRDVLTEPCLVFPLITDIHYAPNDSVFQNFDNSILLMRKLTEEIACDFVANLGDNINGSADQSLMLGYAHHVLAGFHKIGLPYTFCIGNHDTNYDPGEKFTIAETFSAFFSGTKGVVYNEATNGTDFYKDIDNLGIRLVFLNTQYLNAYVISSDTVTWFTNVALNTDNLVVLFTHQALVSTDNVKQGWNDIVPYRASDIVSAIEAFIQNGGTLIQFFGHAHADYAFTSPWLAIGTTCGKFEQVDTTGEGYQAITGYTGSLVSPARTQGTATEQAWDIVVIRPNAKKVNTIRFGAGDDREFTYGS